MFEPAFVKKRGLSHKQKFDKVIEILENCKFDIIYMARIHPISDFERRYFQDQIARINGAIQFIEWFRDNMVEEKRKRFLGIF